MPKSPLIFVHVPKTAGSTLHAILGRLYTQIFTIDGIAPEASLRQFADLDVSSKEALQVIKGHLTLRVADQFKEPFLFTYMREPVDQFLSGYYYIQRAEWNEHHDRVKNIHSLDDYIAYAEREGVHNIQTRHLSNSIENYPHDAYRDLNEDGEALLTVAKQNLDRMDHVFHTHQFDESLLVLRKKLSWESAPYYVVQNKTKNRKKTDSITPDQLARIKELNALDVALFEYSKRLNTQQMQGCELDVDGFREGNKRYQLKAKVGYYVNRLTGK